MTDARTLVDEVRGAACSDDREVVLRVSRGGAGATLSSASGTVRGDREVARLLRAMADAVDDESARKRRGRGACRTGI